MPPDVSERLQERMQELSVRGSVLGVLTESLTPQLADFFGVKEGALVRSVVKNSAAEKAGIKAGDVIVKIDDAKVANSPDVARQLRAVRAKKSTFPVTVVRKQQEITLTVTIEDRRGMREVPRMAPPRIVPLHADVVYCWRSTRESLYRRMEAIRRPPLNPPLSVSLFEPALLPVLVALPVAAA
jgi:hypothetical protein